MKGKLWWRRSSPNGNDPCRYCEQKLAGGIEKPDQPRVGSMEITPCHSKVAAKKEKQPEEVQLFGTGRLYLFHCQIYMEKKQQGIADAKQGQGKQQGQRENKNCPNGERLHTQVLQISDLNEKEEGQTGGVVFCEKQKIIGSQGKQGGQGQSLPKGKQKAKEDPEKTQFIHGHKTNSFLILCPKREKQPSKIDDCYFLRG